jgi:DNA-binding NarL/FixJ family response regulator
MINVMIADDHVMFRRGIRRILDETPDMRIIDEAGDRCELVEKLATEVRVHILLLDISMPGISGIDVLSQVRLLRPDLPILVLSMYTEEQYAIRAIKSGCKGYLVKTSSPEELVIAITKVYRGERYISSSVAENLAAYVARDTEEKLHAKLSNREYDIMCYLASGKSVSEIGRMLNLSIKTVSTYKMRLLKKLCCKNNAELTRYAIENKLI